MQDWPERERYTAEDLLEIIRILRNKENGCPWDKVQTHASIRKNFLEETCEALEAIDADDPAMMREELGDVLMQVAFHTVIEEERGRFDFEQVCREVCEKLVFRHPNIFASSAAENAGINSWDALKNKEKGRTTLADELNTVPATLPALMYAQKMQKRAARRGAYAVTAEDAVTALKAAERGWEEATPENAAEQAGHEDLAHRLRPLDDESTSPLHDFRRAQIGDPTHALGFGIVDDGGIEVHTSHCTRGVIPVAPWLMAHRFLS